MKRMIFELISLFEIFTILGLLMLALVAQNIYLFVLALATLSKQLPEKIIKRLIPIPKWLRDRPEKAMDCGIINKGGIYAKKAGFPSGHTTMVWFLFIYTLLEYVRLQKQGRNILIPLLLTAVFAVLVPVARIRLHCHTVAQIIGGIILGTVWAFLFYTLEQHFLMKNSLYLNHKDKAIRFLDLSP